MWKELTRKNERVQKLLKEEHSQKDVIVRIGSKQFFGFWLWDKELQLHTRVPVDSIRDAEGNIVSFAQSLAIVQLSERLIG
jgi:hypothetical protein